MPKKLTVHERFGNGAAINFDKRGVFPGGEIMDGGSDDFFSGTGFPQVFYLRYHLYSLYFPLLALGVFARSGSRRRARATSGAA